MIVANEGKERKTEISKKDTKNERKEEQKDNYLFFHLLITDNFLQLYDLIKITNRASTSITLGARDCAGIGALTPVGGPPPYFGENGELSSCGEFEIFPFIGDVDEFLIFSLLNVCSLLVSLAVVPPPWTSPG